MPRTLTSSIFPTTPIPLTSPMDATSVSATASATLWLIRSTAFSPTQYTALMAMLSAGEVRRHTAFVRPQRQLQFLIGRNLLRYAIASATTAPRQSISVTERPGNAPHVDIPPEYGKTPYFSLSHSEPFIACLLSTHVPVGLDIEHPRAQRDVLALSKAAFSEEEHDWLLQQDKDLRQAAFYRLWNGKEALYKLAHHQGLAPASFHSGWNCQAVPHPQLSICLCSASPLQSIEVVELDAL